MINTWQDLKKTYLNILSLFREEERFINQKYDKFIKELEEKKKEELAELKNQIAKNNNPKNYDIFCSPYTILYQAGAEIGSVITVKRKCSIEVLQQIFPNKNKVDIQNLFKKDDELFVLEYKCDNVFGQYKFYFKDQNNLKIDDSQLINYFEIIEIIKKSEDLIDVPYLKIK